VWGELRVGVFKNLGSLLAPLKEKEIIIKKIKIKKNKTKNPNPVNPSASSLFSLFLSGLFPAAPLFSSFSPSPHSSSSFPLMASPHRRASSSCVHGHARSAREDQAWQAFQIQQ
jgi:hypothetical protein